VVRGRQPVSEQTNERDHADDDEPFFLAILIHDAAFGPRTWLIISHFDTYTRFCGDPNLICEIGVHKDWISPLRS
jgi:hypothetical protein